MTRLIALERPEVEEVRVYVLDWNRAPSAHAHHRTEVVAASEQEAIDILTGHIGFDIDCWFAEDDE